MQTPHNVSPVNPIPPVVLAIFVVILGVEAVLSFGAQGYFGGPGAVGWRAAAIEDFGFNGAILRWMLETGQFPPEHLLRLLSYGFVHGGFIHAVFAGIMLLALGKMVGDVFSSLATLAVFFVPQVVGALVFGLLLDTSQWLIGAFPGVYGMIGAFTFLMWVRLGQLGEAQARAFMLIGLLLGIQLVFGVLFGGGLDWVAEVAAFATGFGLSFVVCPGGWTALKHKLRQR